MCTSDNFCLYTSIYDVHLWYSYIHVIDTTLQQFCCKNCLHRFSESLQGCLFCLFELVLQCTSLSTKWLKVWKLPKENMAQHKQSPLQVFAFFACNFSRKPPLLWTALPGQCAALCFPARKSELQNQRRKSAPVKLLWPLPQPWFTNKWRTWELVYPNLQVSDWMRINVWNLFKSSESTGNFQEGWIASPDASRSAERRDTSAMDFEDSLPKSDIRHGPEQAIRHGTAKQSPGRNSQSAAMKPNVCLLQLCRFLVGNFGLQFILWDQFIDNGPHPPVICLSAWGTSMLKKRQGLCFGSLFQVPVELPGFLWRDKSRKKTIHGSMVQIKTWPNTALMQTHTTHPAPRAARLSERPLKWTSDDPDTHTYTTAARIL